MNYAQNDPPKARRPLHVSAAKIKTLEVSEAEDPRPAHLSDPGSHPGNVGPSGGPTSYPT